MPPDKSKSPPGGSRPPNGQNTNALGERRKPTTARSPEQTLPREAQTDLTYLRILQRPIALLRPGTRISYPPEPDNVERWGAEIDPERVVRRRRRYPRADRGVALGGGLVVIDIDRKNGKNGFESIMQLEMELGSLPLTATVRTPHGNGQHRYFWGPDDDAPPWRRFRDGVDVLRCGSLTPLPNHFGWTGAEGIYEWENRKRIAALPPAWREAITRVRRSPSRRVGVATRPLLAASPVSIDPALANEMGADGAKGYLVINVRFKLTCALAVIPADIDRVRWLRIAAGIYDALGEDGFELWNEWSATSPRPDHYKPEKMRREWAEARDKFHRNEAAVYGIADEFDPSWRNFYDNEMDAREAGR